jgi:hypothetical protein
MKHLVRDCRTCDIRSVLDWMIDEMKLCDHGVAENDKPVFTALSLILEDELRIRNRKQKLVVPR